MSNVEYRVKNWRSQLDFDREILDGLKVDELEFLCRKYHKDIIRHKMSINKKDGRETKNKKLTYLKELQQRYKQLCEEIHNRKLNIMASVSFMLSCTNNFDVYSGNIFNVGDGQIEKNVSFNANENDYVITYE